MYLDPPAGYRIYRRRVVAAQEGRRVLHLCHPCRVPDSAPTFRWTSGAANDAWAGWMAGLFEPVLGPALVAALQHARAGHLRDIARIDADLDAVLPADEATRSRAHGRRLLLGMIPPAGVRSLWRYRQKAFDDRVPGHLAPVFALRAAAFHVSTRAAVAAYIQCEWQGGTGEDGLPPGNLRVPGLPDCPHDPAPYGHPPA
jgi:hypothetical protein